MQELEKFLADLRTKPLHVRKAILVVTTSVITLFVAITWGYSFQGKLAQLNGERMIAATAAAPTALIGKEASSFWGGVSGLVSELKHQLSF